MPGGTTLKVKNKVIPIGIIAKTFESSEKQAVA
jgi:hypothetical protein